MLGACSAPAAPRAGVRDEAERSGEPIEHLAFSGCRRTSSDGSWWGVLIEEAAQGLRHAHPLALGTFLQQPHMTVGESHCNQSSFAL